MQAWSREKQRQRDNRGRHFSATEPARSPDYDVVLSRNASRISSLVYTMLVARIYGALKCIAIRNVDAVGGGRVVGGW